MRRRPHLLDQDGARDVFTATKLDSALLATGLGKPATLNAFTVAEQVPASSAVNFVDG